MMEPFDGSSPYVFIPLRYSGNVRVFKIIEE